jgi:hypothetical protein
MNKCRLKFRPFSLVALSLQQVRARAVRGEENQSKTWYARMLQPLLRWNLSQRFITTSDVEYTYKNIKIKKW